MALSDVRIKTLKPKDKPYSRADGRGLFLEVMAGGKKVWRLRYRLYGRQEKVTLGEYPYYTLQEARQWREECKGLIAKGKSPAKLKKQEKELKRNPDTVEAFAEVWMIEIVSQTNKNPKNIRRVLDKDIKPAIGQKRLSTVTTSDVHAIIDRIKARGADQSALMTRNIMKRLFAYAIAREKMSSNPAAAIEAKYIAQAKSRDVALTPVEMGKLLRGIYTSSMRRQNKLALHLLILTMVRKSELIKAKWPEIDFEERLWSIPPERMKTERAHLVPLSAQALAMFEELYRLARGSDYILPSPSSLCKHISETTLNAAIRGLDFDIRDFVIHDFRRTASTLLNEMGFHSDWTEKALAHEQLGVRGIYNRAKYLEQRRDMLQQWADFVDAQIEEGRKVITGRFANEKIS